MTDKSKAIAAALAVLLIGIAIGALIVGPVIARHHFNRADRLHGPEGFVTMLEGRIKPDPSQADAVRAILAKYGERLEALRSRERTEAEAVFDSLHAELAPVLTEEQSARIERRKKHGEPHGEPR